MTRAEESPRQILNGVAQQGESAEVSYRRWRFLKTSYLDKGCLIGVVKGHCNRMGTFSQVTEG